jgi:hypothetical protein
VHGLSSLWLMFAAFGVFSILFSVCWVHPVHPLANLHMKLQLERFSWNLVFINFMENFQGVHPVVFAYTFFYYLSQHNNYQNLIHVRLSVSWWYSLLHVSAHRPIIRQYTLIIISQTIELRSARIHIYYILQWSPSTHLTPTVNILVKPVSFLQKHQN